VLLEDWAQGVWSLSFTADGCLIILAIFLAVWLFEVLGAATPLDGTLWALGVQASEAPWFLELLAPDPLAATSPSCLGVRDLITVEDKLRATTIAFRETYQRKVKKTNKKLNSKNLQLYLYLELQPYWMMEE